jgi:hypothetical protein
MACFRRRAARRCRRGGSEKINEGQIGGSNMAAAKSYPFAFLRRGGGAATGAGSAETAGFLPLSEPPFTGISNCGCFRSTDLPGFALAGAGTALPCGTSKSLASSARLLLWSN